MASSTSGTQKYDLDMSKVDEEKKRKYKIPYTKAPKVESGHEFDDSQEDEKCQTLYLRSKNADGSRSKSKSYYDGESSDYVSTKKAKFTTTKFPPPKQPAIFKLSFQPPSIRAIRKRLTEETRKAQVCDRESV
ncbi:hypothetical protein DID88_002959 [Monilinia fructigena]|uniref:Uncharacterized protein n=1 Tax=Monilinia fructigena TaxID=38457 RepID=A0A395INK0_9HELO|nr:hypothetical protein DID88_002959 [Monilinia fructigena]